jgi:ferredoxin--NADP+ reductase
VPNIHQYKIAAPKIAAKAQPGQFIIVRVDEVGERIPLTIADWNREDGSITVVFNEVGRTTHKMAALKEGDSILNVVGPLGIPTHIAKFGTVVCVAAGYGIAAMATIARALKETGNTVISIIRAPSKETLFGDERLGSFSDQLTVVTGDGSYGVDCFILEPLRDVL